MAATAIDSPPNPPSNGPPNSRRERILEAARQCFAGDGFTSATIIDVAKTAGVSRPLVYKHFGDKDGLIDAVLQETFLAWSALNASLAEEGHVLDASEAIERKFAATIEFVRTRPVFRAVLQHDPQIVVRGHLDELRRSRSVSLASTRSIVEAGIARGAFRRDLDPGDVAASLEMTLFSLLQRALGLHPEIELTPALVATTLAIALGGVRAHP